MKRVWRVRVSIAFDMPVYAASKEDAEKIAEKNYEEEMSNVFFTNDVSLTAREINKPGDFEGCIPWGEEEDRTVDEILEVQS